MTFEFLGPIGPLGSKILRTRNFQFRFSIEIFTYPAKTVFLAVLLRNEKSKLEKIAKIEWKLTEDGSFEIFKPPKCKGGPLHFRV